MLYSRRIVIIAVFDISVAVDVDSKVNDMSGIEVVGLVLATLPLVAEGIDKYIASASRAEKLFHPTRELQTYRSLLNIESEVFRNTSELLLGYIANETETQMLLRDPGGQAWNESDLETLLKQLLEGSYCAVRSVLQDMTLAIMELRSRLHLDSDGVGLTLSSRRALPIG